MKSSIFLTILASVVLLGHLDAFPVFRHNVGEDIACASSSIIGCVACCIACKAYTVLLKILMHSTRHLVDNPVDANPSKDGTAQYR